MKREKTEWFPKEKRILAFVFGFLVLSPAILGIYWVLSFKLVFGPYQPRDPC